MNSAAWNGPGQMALRFEIARQIGSGSAGLFKPDGPGAVDQPAFPLLQNALYFIGAAPDAEPGDAGGAGPGRFAAGLEHAVSVVAGVHAVSMIRKSGNRFFERSCSN